MTKISKISVIGKQIEDFFSNMSRNNILYVFSLCDLGESKLKGQVIIIDEMLDLIKRQGFVMGEIPKLSLYDGLKLYASSHSSFLPTS